MSRLKFMGLVSEDEAFSSISVKRFGFNYYTHIPEANKELKYKLAEITRENNTFAVLHENYMYFIGDEEPLFDMAEKLQNEGFVRDFSRNVEECLLKPTNIESHHHVTRRLFYVALKSSYRNSIKQAPFGGRKDEDGRIVLIPPQGRNYLTEEIYFYYGLQVLLELLPSGFGVLWYDLLTIPRMITDKGEKRVSYPVLRRYGVLDDFREYSVLSSRGRFEKTNEFFEKIFGSKREVRVDMKVKKIVFNREIGEVPPSPPTSRPSRQTSLLSF